MRVEWLRAASSVRLDRLAESFAELLADPRGNARTKIDAARGLLSTEQTRAKLWGLNWTRRDDEESS